jgi:prepilin-type N-terminal cleavage/methylation domain-containing protein
MRQRNGFSLVEVIVALVVLSVMMLGAQALAARMIRTAAVANVQVTAGQLAEDRIDFVRLDPAYDSLAARYGTNENPVTGYPGYRRTTAFTRTTTVTTNGTTDYFTMTVRVTHQQLSTPVARTIVITNP